MADVLRDYWWVWLMLSVVHVPAAWWLVLRALQYGRSTDA